MKTFDLQYHYSNVTVIIVSDGCNMIYNILSESDVKKVLTGAMQSYESYIKGLITVDQR